MIAKTTKIISENYEKNLAFSITKKQFCLSFSFDCKKAVFLTFSYKTAEKHGDNPKFGECFGFACVKVKEKRKRGCKSCPFILYLIFDKAHKKRNKKIYGEKRW